ncbi:cytochrome b5 reductase with F-box domain [Achlya hypogyna]|uniref:Cytochrome b5 reductase with F-box domain n=1 Tax=Achlya hypogyna TaxID=1202772 RepID=A0A1V9ZR53_ACHHY|nr:cytochrome b5 reductase with F-box domain [Achlya hypogyna]
MIQQYDAVAPCEYCLEETATASDMSTTFFMASCLFLFGFLCSSMRDKTANDTQLSPFMRPRRRPLVLAPRSAPPVASSALVAQQYGALVDLPLTVVHEILLYLDASDLVPCTMLNTTWRHLLCDNDAMLWAQVFKRDFGEDGRRFNAPCGLSWHEYYFQHRHTRPLERIKLLEPRQCVAVEGHVYDVTDFLYEHPGGHRVIADVLGTDATAVWLEFEHSDGAKRAMAQLLVPDDICPAFPLPGNFERIASQRHTFFQRWLRKVVPSIRAAP